MSSRALFSAFLFLLPSIMAAQTVVSMKIDGNINPVAAQFIHRGIATAGEQKAQCLVVRLNTPGGLLKSTRVIAGDILASPVPVVVYVAPDGARAGSAGVFITLAAHIAAMSPGTNIGAAHPVGMRGEADKVMDEKTTNDAAAFIRTIAANRKRNVEWAEEAVRKSISVTANEALENHVIDLVAGSERELLNRIDGRTVEIPAGATTLRTANARITSLEMSFGERVLDVLSDPDMAYILLMLGLYGMLFELYNPGAILPGIVGVISLILAFYSLHTLPVNFAGLALIIFAVILFLLEIKIVSHGLLAIGGIVSLFLGSMMLIPADPSSPGLEISRSVIIASTIVSALFFLFVLGLGLKAQRLKPVSGSEGLIGETGEARSDLEPLGTVWAHGEVWNAKSAGGKIRKGEKVRIVGITGLQLQVELIQDIS